MVLKYWWDIQYCIAQLLCPGWTGFEKKLQCGLTHPCCDTYGTDMDDHEHLTTRKAG